MITATLARRLRAGRSGPTWGRAAGGRPGWTCRRLLRHGVGRGLPRCRPASAPPGSDARGGRLGRAGDRRPNGERSTDLGIGGSRRDGLRDVCTPVVDQLELGDFLPQCCDLGRFLRGSPYFAPQPSQYADGIRAGEAEPGLPRDDPPAPSLPGLRHRRPVGQERGPGDLCRMCRAGCAGRYFSSCPSPRSRRRVAVPFVTTPWS